MLHTQVAPQPQLAHLQLLLTHLPPASVAGLHAQFSPQVHGPLQAQFLLEQGGDLSVFIVLSEMILM